MYSRSKNSKYYLVTFHLSHAHVSVSSVKKVPKRICRIEPYRRKNNNLCTYWFSAISLLNYREKYTIKMLGN